MCEFRKSARVVRAVKFFQRQMQCTFQDVLHYYDYDFKLLEDMGKQLKERKDLRNFESNMTQSKRFKAKCSKLSSSIQFLNQSRSLNDRDMPMRMNKVNFNYWND